MEGCSYIVYVRVGVTQLQVQPKTATIPNVDTSNLDRTCKRSQMVLGNINGATIGWITTVITCCSSIVALSVILFWCHHSMMTQLKQQVKKMRNPTATRSQKTKYKTTIKLFSISWVSVITFTAVTIGIAIHCVTILSDQYSSFVHDFEATNLETTLLVSILFYLLGKFLIYFVLYLRLFFLLFGSMFAYSNKLYLLIKLVMTANIIVALLAFGFSIGEDNISILLTNIFRLIYLLFDIGIPIWLNILFIKKLYQIGNFFMQPVDTASVTVTTTATPARTHSSVEDNDPSRRNLNLASYSVSPETSTNGDTSTTNRDIDVDVDRMTTTTTNTNTNMNRQKASSGMVKHVLKTPRNRKLLGHVARLSVLSTTIAVSSFIFLGVSGVYTTIQHVRDRATLMNVILWITMSIDSCINVVCLILYFDFAISLYNQICGKCCKTRCVATVLPKCICCCK